MRFPLYGTVTNGNGQVMEGATVTIYDGETDVLATIYDSYSGGSVIAGSVVEADSSGWWQVFVDDANYISGDIFKIITASANLGTITRDWITAF